MFSRASSPSLHLTHIGSRRTSISTLGNLNTSIYKVTGRYITKPRLPTANSNSFSTSASAKMIVTPLTELLGIRVWVLSLDVTVYIYWLDEMCVIGLLFREECNGTSRLPPSRQLESDLDIALHRVGKPELVAAVSNAGGLGTPCQLIPRSFNK